jgi:ubiquinone/menaquinone biosynthesis C-methylase UbiE
MGGFVRVGAPGASSPYCWRCFSAAVLLLGTLHKNGALKPLRAGSRVLDCGIGTVAFSAALAQATGVPLHITGVDLSALMLQVARRTLRGSAQAVQLHQATSAALPFNDQTFDAVISAHMLEHFADPRQGLSELVRVLRPGAPLIIAVTTPGWFDTLQQLRWRITMLNSTPCRSGCAPWALPYTIPTRYTPPDRSSGNGRAGCMSA